MSKTLQFRAFNQRYLPLDGDYGRHPLMCPSEFSESAASPTVWLHGNLSPLFLRMKSGSIIVQSNPAVWDDLFNSTSSLDDHNFNRLCRGTSRLIQLSKIRVIKEVYGAIVTFDSNDLFRREYSDPCWNPLWTFT